MQDDAATTVIHRETAFGQHKQSLVASRNHAPRTAQWLGGLGAVPFVALSGAALLLDEPLRQQAQSALAIYGAVILSFLGGVHWGLAIAKYGNLATENAAPRRLLLSVIPALVGWGALLLPSPIEVLVLAGAFAVLGLFDARASQAGEAPTWYPKLRWPLTFVVVAALLIGAAA